jgi:hypothetical protein
MWFVSRYGWIIVLTGKEMNPTWPYNGTSKRYVKSFCTKTCFCVLVTKLTRFFLERTVLVRLLKERNWGKIRNAIALRD